MNVLKYIASRISVKTDRETEILDARKVTKGSMGRYPEMPKFMI